MQMKNEALLVAEHTGAIQHQQLSFHLFIACSRYSSSFGDAHTEVHSQGPSFGKVAIHHCALTDSTMTL